MKRVRVIASLVVLVSLIAVFLFVPLPFHVTCNFDVKPRDATTVYAAVGGRLTEIKASAGQQVEEGQVLALLDNIELKLNVTALEGQLREMEAELKVLEKQQRFDESAGLRINEVLEQRRALQEVLAERMQEFNNLTVKAPLSGTVLPVADKPDREMPDGQLPGWIGGALEPKNLNARLAASDRICQIGDPQQLVAEIIVDQADVELVRAAVAQRQRDGEPGVPAVLMLDALPGLDLPSEIERVALAELTETPLSLSTHAGGDVDSVADARTGVPRPLSTSYPAIALLPDTGGAVQLGMRGKAKIYTGWQPLGRRLYRFVTRTFHFEL